MKAGSATSDELPNANAKAFKAWLFAEIGQLVPLLDSVLEFGMYGATLVKHPQFSLKGKSTE